MSVPIRQQAARELAMQTLFLWDSNGQSDVVAARQAMSGHETSPPDETTRERALAMATGAWGNRQQADQWIVRMAPQWPPRRQPTVDRNILRLAIWEMTHATTPPKVVIDEAIELAKRFSTEGSPAFVNGVLDAIWREVRALTSTER